MAAQRPFRRGLLTPIVVPTEDRCRGATVDEEVDRMANNTGAAAGSGAIYGLGIFGAWVWFWQQADSFWQYVLVFFEGVFWPALMVYQAFQALD